MKLVGKNQLFLTYGKTYEVIEMRLVTEKKHKDNFGAYESIKPYIEYLVIDDIGTECWHKDSIFFTLEEWRDIKLINLGYE